MRYLIIISLISFYACSSNNINKGQNNNFKFSSKMSIDEFEKRLEQYAENSPYPNIDE